MHPYMYQSLRYRRDNLSDKEKVYRDVYAHNLDKFGEGGYAELHLPESVEFARDDLERRKDILHNEEEFQKVFDEVYDNLVSTL